MAWSGEVVVGVVKIGQGLEAGMKGGRPVPFCKVGDEEFRLGEGVFQGFLAVSDVGKPATENGRIVVFWAF